MPIIDMEGAAPRPVTHFILVRNALALRGWEVLIMPQPTRDKQDRWYSSPSDARIYASGVQAATGWSILDAAQERGGHDAIESIREEEAPPLLKRMGAVYAASRLWGYLTHRQS